MSKSSKPDNYMTVICLLKCLPSLFLGYSRYGSFDEQKWEKRAKNTRRVDLFTWPLGGILIVYGILGIKIEWDQ